MFQHIFNILSIESILLGIPLFGMLLLLAAMRQEICFALGFPAYIFLAQLRYYLPVSNSAGAALFPLAAGIVVFFKTFRFRLGLCEKLILASALLMVISIAYSPTPIYGRDKAILYCFMVVPVIVLAPNVITNVKSLRTVVALICLTSVAFVLISLVMRMQLGSIDGRTTGMLDVIRAGQFLGMSSIIGCVYMIHRSGAAKKVFFVAIVIAGTFLMFISGTRGAVLAFALSCLFMHWFAHIDWLQRLFTKAHITFATIFFGIIIAVFGGFFLKSFLPENTYQRFAGIENFFNNFTLSQVENWKDSRSRTFNYFSAMKYFSEHPLTGTGAGGYKTVLVTYGGKAYKDRAADDLVHVYPHNVILEFACEQGVLGLILILWILYLNLRMILRLRKVYGMNPQNSFLILACVTMYFYGLCVSMMSLDVPRMMILWWGMGLLIAADKLFRGKLQTPSKERDPSCRTLCFAKRPQA